MPTVTGEAQLSMKPLLKFLSYTDPLSKSLMNGNHEINILLNAEYVFLGGKKKTFTLLIV